MSYLIANKLIRLLIEISFNLRRRHVIIINRIIFISDFSYMR